MTAVLCQLLSEQQLEDISPAALDLVKTDLSRIHAVHLLTLSSP